ncbi:CsiV family protein [Pseudomonas sp. LS1212]|uniref:CsiV family protein n=1 Tax=Pseudomonas sp. LS1212 TaxID=2972478 RepID=UPI00215D4665|nr:CsiV family protein [Pseudomonas sp. LS1212]UVJ42566.1 CsiV family protein [Pseudomonas sp. LS1212]
MRFIRSLTLLLALFAPAVFADGQYQVDMILVRQNAVPAVTTAVAPEDWAAGAPVINAKDERQPGLTAELEKLQASGDYTVLLNKAWRQSLGETPSSVAISEGKRQFGHFPIEGNLSLSLNKTTNVVANFWVNQIDGNGTLTASEQLTQESKTPRNGDLIFLDGGHLALLIKVTPL